MEQEIKQRLTRRDIWMRALFMVFFLIAYSVAEAVVVLLVLFQFVTILVTGDSNRNALRLGNNLSTYVYQILQFQTFNTESRPFPFSDWPDEALEDGPRDEMEDADDSWTAPDEAADD
ncbi:MAG: DUF4389 domain-containing protein, partial [Gammaproteobacteria bacterium]|nr:DUF4389 domain-containing protein [Gammaproteobacteria bacterium]